jgi:hypothetical protein
MRASQDMALATQNPEETAKGDYYFKWSVFESELTGLGRI